MKIDAEVIGIDDSLERLQKFVESEERSIKDALEWILREMCSYCKEFGPWKDHTGNLRNSISINMETMKVWESSPTKIQALEALKTQNEKPVILVEGDTYIGCLSAGMNYSLWVNRLCPDRRQLLAA